MPASPPPTTTTSRRLIGRSAGAARPGRGGHGGLLPARQRQPAVAAPARARRRSGRAAAGRCRPSRRSRPRCAGRAAAAAAAPRRTSSAARAADSRTSRTSGGVRVGATSPRGVSRSSHPEPVEVLGGQVDPAVAEVLAHVAQDVGLLQRDAERVGAAGTPPGRVGCRTRRGRAGRSTRRRSGSSRPGRRRSSYAAPRTSISTPSTSSSKASSGIGNRRRASASAASTGSSLSSSACTCVPERREPLHLLLGRQVAVADVVDAPGEGVDGAHRPALLRRAAAGCRSGSCAPGCG